MGVGTNDRELPYAKSPDATFEDLCRALGTIGKIEEADREALFLRGTTRFGFQKVRLKVNIAASDAGSTVSIHALADDVWGKGAKKGIDKLVDALRET